MRTALLTGSDGFIGRRTNEELSEAGWDTVRCDTKHGSDALDIFRRVDQVFDLVVHCAYDVGGRERIDGRNIALSHNLQLDAAMFRWAVETGQRAVLYYSSSAAYPVRLQTEHALPHDLAEDDIDLADIRQPDADYGLAKVAGERQAAAAAELGLRVHVLRPFSGFGHTQDPAYPFPALLRRAVSLQPGKALGVWGPYGQTRDWVHVDDVVRASLRVYEEDLRGPVNICTGAATEFGDLARLMLRELGKAAPIDYQHDRPTGVFRRVGDPTLMREVYEPRVTIEEAVRQALA